MIPDHLRTTTAVKAQHPWRENRDGDIFHPRLWLAIHKSPDDGWYYVMECDEDGDIIEGVDAVVWEKTLSKAMRSAGLVKR